MRGQVNEPGEHERDGRLVGLAVAGDGRLDLKRRVFADEKVSRCGDVGEHASYFGDAHRGFGILFEIHLLERHACGSVLGNEQFHRTTQLPQPFMKTVLCSGTHTIRENQARAIAGFRISLNDRDPESFIAGIKGKDAHIEECRTVDIGCPDRIETPDVYSPSITLYSCHMLLLARHHQSEYNKLGLWTGLHDPPLDVYGVGKSKEMSALVCDLELHQAFTSELRRTKETLAHMLGDRAVPTTHAVALNERDYGDFTAKNKWDVLAQIGEGEFKKLRRSWDYSVPGGESLQMVHDRAVPFYRSAIIPHALVRNVLVVAHGNSLRALIKHVESVSDEAIADVEMPFGAVYLYTIDAEGRMASKEVRQIASDVPA